MFSLLQRAALGTVVAVLGCGGARSPRDRSQPAPQSAPTVSAADIADHPTNSPEELLQGRVSGVNVTSTPDGIAVRIRGGSSAYGNNEPLYILDGMPFQPGPNGILSGVHASDIESIKVLKDAAETAMYGVRGANGVIIITTKRAKATAP